MTTSPRLPEFKASPALSLGVELELQLLSLRDYDLTADALAALVFCTPPRARHVLINGRQVVEDGELLTVDLPALVARHNRLARQLVNGD